MSFTTGTSEAIAKKINLLKKSLQTASRHLSKCELCPRKCGVDRQKGERGYCRAGIRPAVYSYFAHNGEEPPISGTRGSGTIFFTYCTMRCVYCQNYSFSQLSNEKEITTHDLARLMLSLQEKGCHNINLVTPTHFVPQILEALLEATTEGLNIPIVYNTGGYDQADTLKLLNGIIDIYLPDMRYGDNANAKRFSDAPDYVEVNKNAVKEMFLQAGSLEITAEGIAKKGLIIRHLILPGNLASTDKVLQFISENISKDTYISLMSQYYPAYKACNTPEISKEITKNEYDKAARLFFEYGLSKGWIQEFSGQRDPKLMGTNIKKIWPANE